MQVWLRILIVWFVAIALPIQGIAGATMAHCASSHERMGAAAQMTAHPHADHDVGVAHHHAPEALHGHDAAGHDQAAQGLEKADNMSSLAQYKCSSCASCCAGLALPGEMPRIPQVAAAPAVFAEEVVSVDTFASDRPDRPPRTHLV